MKMEININAGDKRKRVFLVDHFPISRLAIGEWLSLTDDLSVCGEADNEEAALAGVRRLKPDVVVTEVLRQQDLGFIRGLHKRYPRLPILVFSFRDEEWYAARALEAGADGYLMKGMSPAGLVNGIRSALEGRVVLSSEMRAQLLLKCASRRKPSMLLRGAPPRPCSGGKRT
jgi:DNA-binding NarL/FixJ family response regulator